MPLFESYDRRIKQINEALANTASAPLKKRNNSAFPRESTPVKL